MRRVDTPFWATLTVTVLAFLAATTPASAGHIPGHNDGDPVFPIPIPDFDGGVVYGTMIGPEAGVRIVGTRFDVNFRSDGEMPASELLITFTAQVDNDFRSMTVSGADLGFTSGAGDFQGTLQTDYFNGEVWQFPNWPHSLPEIEIHSTQGGVPGVVQISNSFIYLDVIPVPEPGALALLLLSASAAALRRSRRP